MIIKYSMTLKSPAMTMKDGIIGKDVDLVTKLDKDGLPYFSASQIKGILREKTTVFSKALGIDFPLKKLFGEEGVQNFTMRFSPLTIDKKKYEDYKEFLTDDRSGIRIDRGSKTTSEGSLFSYEFIRRGLEFHGEIEFFEKLEKKDLEFFKACLERVDFIGGLKSRGLGKVKIKIKEEIEKNKSNRQKIDTKEFKKYKYILKPLENIILKNKEIGNEITTNNYLQGSTLRGALITLLSRDYDIDTNLLIKNLKVGQGLPEGYFISPASVFETKYPIDKTNKTKVRVDKLLFKNKKDEVDNKEVKFERFGSQIVNEKYEKSHIEKTSETNIAIDIESRTSKEGQIFNKEILLVKDIEFSGEIYISEDIVKKLSGTNIYLGKGKSKGFGKCLITFEKSKNKEEKVTKDKLEKLSNEIKLEEDDKEYFTVDFISDMILPFMDTPNIGDQIKDLLALEGVTWEESKSFINIETIDGYSQLNGIRKATEFAISKGGVLTFSVENFSDELITKLEKHQKNGIGTRKNEGFGEIEISSKKHLEVK